MGSRVISLTLQRNFLESLGRRRACTEEIRVLASRITRGTKRNRAEEARIIELRVGNIEKEIRRAKNQWTKDSIKLKRALASLNWRFNQLKRVTLNEIWESEKERLRRKQQWILWKQRIALPREVEGIPIHEEDLREKFGDWQEEGVILGGIEVSEAVRAYMRLPGNFKILEEVDLQVSGCGRSSYVFMKRLFKPDKNK